MYSSGGDLWLEIPDEFVVDGRAINAIVDALNIEVHVNFEQWT